MTDKTPSPAPRYSIHFADERDFCRFASLLIGASYASATDALQRFEAGSLHGALTWGPVTAAPARDHAAELAAALGWPGGISATPDWDDLITVAARARIASAPAPAVPDVLFDGYAVLKALTEQATRRTSPENVSDVLDAVVRLLRANQASVAADGEPTEETAALLRRLRDAGADYTIEWGEGELYDLAADKIEQLEAEILRGKRALAALMADRIEAADADQREREMLLQNEARDAQATAMRYGLDVLSMREALQEAEAGLEVACKRHPQTTGFEPSEHAALRIVREALAAAGGTAPEMADVPRRQPEQAKLDDEYRKGFIAGQIDMRDRDQAPGMGDHIPDAGKMVGGWTPIDQPPPDGELVAVFWLDTDAHHPERHDLDYREDGVWRTHYDHWEHVQVIGGYGVQEEPPYTHWKRLGRPGPDDSSVQVTGSDR